ncbi:alpha-ketoglutarate-dependent dioxygenase AlkB [Shewanella sp. D64]|uniref:alpha-ketoglutarate-dependent dioxygenase AlkB family protein n=1 Tax=unclassified Shewanella TaxID=196818 RepID=UPI0022BA3E79|nr:MULTISPECIES: alpha-ketoglutarate-dependent dioxygenase AlkB [unclassified Shewanella]MEC4728536.1 alpha-ketoglutarate-dependent dioxygenase AlkB [Shewanella sp. D64]MEC4740540.1 alpha-ketoglutarate-dependent dioxygenase AlkB [Shewanella sp. E94]WBJ94265.1 alpha-ketoglutarate-dependent dioxygenase AlkB [Shewanella sp. MTB7]
MEQQVLLEGVRDNFPFTLLKGYLNPQQQQALLKEAQSYPFTRPIVQVFGQSHVIPRSQAWFGDLGCHYFYSGLFIEALPWPKYAHKLRVMLHRDFGFISNGVLVNHYVDGTQSMGWHSDDEPEIVSGSDIASLTLGASRDFFLRHKETLEKVKLTLDSGDLLLMHWPMQQSWQHSLPKRMGVHKPRVNYTFRSLSPHYHNAK